MCSRILCRFHQNLESFLKFYSSSASATTFGESKSTDLSQSESIEWFKLNCVEIGRNIIGINVTVADVRFET